MRIAFLTASRGRPAGLVAMLKAAEMLSSGRNEICFCVSICPSDSATDEALNWLMDHIKPALLYHMFRRDDDVTPGAALNDLIQTIDADIYAGLNDDIIPLCMNWDLGMAEIILGGRAAACWIEATDPSHHTYQFWASKAIEAIGRRPLPECFPFWFIDMWMAEIHMFAFGERPPGVRGLTAGGRRGPTQGLRDVAFWARLFAHLRPSRIKLGHKLAKAYKMAPPFPDPLIADMAVWDSHFISSAAKFEEEFGGRPPEPYYLKAKAEADKLLAIS